MQNDESISTQPSMQQSNLESQMEDLQNMGNIVDTSTLERSDTFTIRYDDTNNYIACGYSSGKLSLIDLKVGNSNILHSKTHSICEFPITCLRWKPKNRTTLLCTTAEGLIFQVHSSTGKVLQTIEEKDNPLMCCDYSVNGKYFATGGNDKVVRLYDDETKTLVSKLETRSIHLPQHSNRIFSVKFHPTDENLLFSAGWDNTILLYDVRAKETQDFLYGPHVCGDGMDVKGDLLLCASWSKTDQIQFFDLKNKKKIGNFQVIVKENKVSEDLNDISYLYSCRFSPNNELFCVTGSNNNMLRIYDYSKIYDTNPLTKKIEVKYNLDTQKMPLYCCDFSKDGKKLVYGGGNKLVKLIDV